MPANPINQFILGTAIKITTSINIATATEAHITIQNSSDTYIITDANMTNDADGIYSYTWQSATTDEDGRYRVTIKIKSGNYTTVKEAFFDTIDPEDYGETNEPN